MNSASRRRLRFAVLLFGLTISSLLGILCVLYVDLLIRDFALDPTRRVSNAMAGIFGFVALIALTVVTAAFAIEVGIPVWATFRAAMCIASWNRIWVGRLWQPRSQAHAIHLDALALTAVAPGSYALVTRPRYHGQNFSGMRRVLTAIQPGLFTCVRA